MFNQSLSFDTSKVTTMYAMFYVRSARDLLPSLESAPPRACRLRRRHPSPSRLLALAPRAAPYALFSTRQGASAFNQPLSFDTSRVITMHAMFYVRSAHALGPRHSQSEPTLCTPLAPPSPHAPSTPPGPHL